MMRAVPRRVLSEPLVHFAGLGLLFFAVHAALRPARGEALTVDAARVEATAGELARRLGRAAAPDEVAAALQVELDEERLYREALALGLDRDDPIVRRRLIQKLRFVHEDLAGPAEPGDAELRRGVRAPLHHGRAHRRHRPPHEVVPDVGREGRAVPRQPRRRQAADVPVP